MVRKQLTALVLLIIAGVTLTGCDHLPGTQALSDGAIGAGAGAVVGTVAGIGPGAGAAIGGGLGALAGAL